MNKATKSQAISDCRVNFGCLLSGLIHSLFVPFGVRFVRPENLTGCPGSPPIREILPPTVMFANGQPFPPLGVHA
jgi:hypothetical protein